jgi:ankyrin repeat protein
MIYMIIPSVFSTKDTKKQFCGHSFFCSEIFTILGRQYALTKASIEGKLDIVEFFINNYKISEREYNNAFKLAAKNGHLNILQLLFNNKHKIVIEVDVALFDATANRLKEQYDTVKFLIDIGANVNTVEYGNSVLYRAIYYRHKKLVDLLKKTEPKLQKLLVKSS